MGLHNLNLNQSQNQNQTLVVEVVVAILDLLIDLAIVSRYHSRD